MQTPKKDQPQFVRTLFGVLLVAILAAATVITTLGLKNSIEASRDPVEKRAQVAVSTGIVSNRINATIESVPFAQTTISAQGTVTRDGAAINEEISAGSVIGVINERPIFALEGAVPMYRSLGRGSSGTDVSQLQEGLKKLGYSISDPAGTYGPYTATAVSQWYQKNAFPFVGTSGTPLSPGQSVTAGIPQQELVFLPSLPAVAADACGTAGTQSDATLCTLTSQKKTAYIKVPSTLLGDQNISGLSARLMASEPVDGTVGDEVELTLPESASSAAAPQEVTSESQEKYRYFTFTLPEDQRVPDDAAGASIVITVETSGEEGFIVPSLALQSDTGASKDAYWLESVDGDHISVDVGLCYEGECAVTGDDVAEGLSVLLPAGTTAGVN